MSASWLAGWLSGSLECRLLGGWARRGGGAGWIGSSLEWSASLEQWSSIRVHLKSVRYEDTRQAELIPQTCVAIVLPGVGRSG